METALSTPQQDMVWQKISDLRSLLERQDPLIAGHLKTIHAELSKYEELVHLLSDEQMREIMTSQQYATATVLVTKVVKTSTASITRQAKGIKAEDL